MDEQFFDDLARGLYDGTISRRRALKGIGAARCTYARPCFSRSAAMASWVMPTSSKPSSNVRPARQAPEVRSPAMIGASWTRSIVALGLGGEPGDRLEAPDLAWRTVAAVGGFLFVLWRALFGGVQDVLEAAPDLGARSVVGEPEPEGRRGECREDAEEEDGVLDPGENEQHGERHPEYAPEREILSALVRQVGGQVGAASVFVDLLHPKFDRLRLEQRPVA